ncbi:MAG: zinc finger protein [Thermocrispum sp.]
MDAPFAPRPDETFRAICGVDVTPVRTDFVELGHQWLAATCWDCDAAWRTRTGMSPNHLRPR